MASNGIRGITISLGADTQPLERALKDVNKQSKNLQSELKEIERGLKFDPSNVTLVAQKQQLLTQSIQATSDKLDVLRQAQGRVEQQFRNGEIGEESYRAFRRELVNTETQMRDLQSQVSNLNTDQERLAQTNRRLGAFFDATNSNVEQYADTLGTRLTQAIRNGTASADQMERALRLMGRQALGASTDIDEMRRVLNRINEGGSIDDVRNELQQMNAVIVTAQDELKQIDKLLQFNPNNIELLAQKQELLNRSIQDTSTELQQLQQRQSQVEAQFRSGQIGEEEYRAFQRQIEQTEQSLRGYQNQLDQTNREQDQVRSSTRQLQTLFDATGTSVDQFADVLGNDLTRAIREGRATSAQLEQALDRIGQSALGSRIDLNQMRDALRNIDNGANLDEIRADLDRIADSANQAQDDVKGLGDSLSGAMGGLVAGGGIAGTVEKALDTSSLNTKINVTLELEEESSEIVRQTIKNVETYGVDAEAALEGVRKQWALNSEATDEANAKVIEAAGVIAGAYSTIDFSELIQEANEISKTFGITNEEALALTDSLLKVGFPPEQLDIISEYGNQLVMAGFNAEEIQAIMAAGVETGTWNIDNLLDGVKEGRIKLAEFGASIDDATTKMIEGTGISAKQLDAWGDAVAAGGTEGTKAMQEVAEALVGIEDKTKQNELGVKFFGTLWEEQGTNITDTLLNMDSHMTTTKENQDQLNESIDKMNSDPAVQMQQAFQDMMTALQPLLTMVAEFVTKIAEWIAANPGFTAALTAIGVVLGIVVGAFAALMPAIGALVQLWPTLVTAFGAISAPITIAVAAITGIVAALILAYNKVEWFRDGVNAIWNAIKDYTSQAFGAVKELVSSLISSTVDFAKGILDKFKGFWDENGQAIMTIVQLYFNNIKSYIEMIMGVIKGIFEVVWPIISGVIRYTWETIQLVIETALDLILGIINVAMDLLTGDWKGAWEGIKQIGEDIMNNIIGFFKDIDLRKTGKDMIQGLVNGIKSMASAVLQAITNIVNDAIGAAKDLLGINSPSRVFMEIGEFTNEGFIEGINNSSRRLSDAVANVYGSLSNSAQKSMQYGRVATSTTSTVHNSRNFNLPAVNIYTQESGDKAMERTLRRLAFEFKV